MPHIDVLITIHNRQSDEEGQTHTVKVTTEGKLYRRPEENVLIYRETESSGLDNTTTKVTIPQDGSEVVITRIGDHEMKMHFQKGNHYQTRLATPFGYVDMGFFTQNLDVKIGDKQGEIRIDYSLDFNYQRPISNRINIKFHTMGEEALPDTASAAEETI